MRIQKRILTDIDSQAIELQSGIKGLLSDFFQLQCAVAENKALIFRGQPDSTFNLFPSAFRKDQIAKIKGGFPISSYIAWCVDEKFRENVAGWACNSFDRLMKQELFRRLLEITFYIMQYNYSFQNFFLVHQKNFDDNSCQIMNRRRDWSAKETFHAFFCRNLQNALTRISLDNCSILHESFFEEEFTGFDESFPQHYGIPTTGLDWSYNPFVSLYFATDNIPVTATHFSVYVYRLLSSQNKNPLILKHGHPDINNPRILNQEGVFICIQSACRFYFKYGRWPCIEDYLCDGQGNFELIKYEIPICYAQECRNLAETEGKNPEFLFPDTKSQILLV